MLTGPFGCAASPTRTIPVYPSLKPSLQLETVIATVLSTVISQLTYMKNERNCTNPDGLHAVSDQLAGVEGPLTERQVLLEVPSHSGINRFPLFLGLQLAYVNTTDDYSSTNMSRRGM